MDIVKTIREKTPYKMHINEETLKKAKIIVEIFEGIKEKSFSEDMEINFRNSEVDEYGAEIWVESESLIIDKEIKMYFQNLLEQNILFEIYVAPITDKVRFSFSLNNIFEYDDKTYSPVFD